VNPVPERTSPTSGIRACLVPHIPFGLIHGGAEVQAERTLQKLNAQGNHAFWLDFTDTELLKQTDVFHFFGASAEFGYWIHSAVPFRPVLVSPIFSEPSVLRRFAWKYEGLLPGTTSRTVHRLLHEATLLLPNSHAEARQLRALFGVDESRMRIIPNGVDTDFVGTDPVAFRQRYLQDWPADVPFVLCVGRIERRKNQLLLAQACLAARAHLVLIGQLAPNTDLDYQQTFLDLVAAHGDHLKYLGELPREQLPDAYTAAAVHALVSTWETPGLASLEAGLNGCNLVVGEDPSVREYFAGIATIVHQDVTSVRHGVEHALAMPRNGQGQAEVIARQYTWDRVARLTAEAYREAVDLYNKGKGAV
jgi:glycosyltransferase involved in cell wall biosynthesis